MRVIAAKLADDPFPPTGAPLTTPRPPKLATLSAPPDDDGPVAA
jgi:hypothetical protein